MPLLEVKNLRKRFGDTEVLKGVSFTLDGGEVLSIIGASGGGKTTLLRCLDFLETPDRVISREELMEKVWGYEYYGDLRAVDVAMRRMREKLEDNPADPQHFMTRRGAGYYLHF